MFLVFYAPKMLKMGLGPLSSLDCAMIPKTIVNWIIRFLINISIKGLNQRVVDPDPNPTLEKKTGSDKIHHYFFHLK